MVGVPIGRRNRYFTFYDCIMVFIGNTSEYYIVEKSMRCIRDYFVAVFR